MAWRNFRELLAWALFVLVTAVHLHSRTQLERCMTQLDSSRTQMRARAASPVAETSGPREVILRDEPSGTVGHVQLADATSGKPLPSDFVRARGRTNGELERAPCGCAGVCAESVVVLAYKQAPRGST